MIWRLNYLIGFKIIILTYQINNQISKFPNKNQIFKKIFKKNKMCNCKQLLIINNKVTILNFNNEIFLDSFEKDNSLLCNESFDN